MSHGLGRTQRSHAEESILSEQFIQKFSCTEEVSSWKSTRDMLHLRLRPLHVTELGSRCGRCGVYYKLFTRLVLTSYAFQHNPRREGVPIVHSSR